MIDAKSLGSDWIFAVSKQKKADPILVEKVIQALWLLEGLVLSGLPFTFKGGTALMLKLASAKRLSIDIDIIIPDNDDSLSTLLNKVGQERGFTSVEEQKRETKSSIEKAHSVFFLFLFLFTRMKHNGLRFYKAQHSFFLRCRCYQYKIANLIQNFERF